ncbi:DUF1932 domain-containing protein [Nonomuraea salmonea]|uniref:DUF1932 domain-containing protein n=1 Tax=Nonomuraea salmonea TaxID=46181 RepID=UPI003CD0879F
METVTDADERFVVRLLRGAAQHGTRRVHEMEAATRMLASLGVPPHDDARHHDHPRRNRTHRPPHPSREQTGPPLVSRGWLPGTW